MTAESTTPPMATPRIAAGALFVDDEDRVLLVKPTYKKSWDIPGGYVEPGESPYEACVREVHEELGIQPEIGRILVIDWAPNDAEGDKLLFVFDGGRLADSQVDSITLPASELMEHGFFTRRGIAERLNDRLVRRVTAAYEARNQNESRYLEYGQLPMKPTIDVAQRLKAR